VGSHNPVKENRIYLISAKLKIASEVLIDGLAKLLTIIYNYERR
jgi:hypothetical protein